MSYIALARKWRPRTFSQLLGQEHINKALINSLNHERLHHAYLFTGTRGVGKTSIARLLAKALNCEQGIRAEPCLQCEACHAIEQGCFIDLIELDGASKTRVEDTRELLENVPYAPANGRFKIYLIDEVHMLSQHSFNALLKTLEEPPAHVKFLLATTDPQKLPVTVLSRCLQFNLKPLQVDIICHHLQHILKDEQLTFDTKALELLAMAARGSMRDALSLLDQAIVSSDNHLHTQDVKNILGHTQQDYALQLLQALAELDPQKLISISKQIADEGGNFQHVLDEILSYLHQMSVHQTLPDNHSFISPKSEIIALSKKFTPEDTQLFFQIALKSLEEIQIAPTLAIGFEMTLLRMHTFKPATQATTPPLAYQTAPKNLPADTSSQSVPESSSMTTKDTNQTTYQEPSLDRTPQPITSMMSLNKQPKNNENNPTENWKNILPQLELTDLALSAAEHTEFVSKMGAEIILRAANGHQSVFTTSVIKRIEEALSNYFKETIKLTLRTDETVLSSPAQQKKIEKEKQRQDAEAVLQNDPFFQRLQQEFSAELDKNSIALLQDDL